MHGAIAHHPPGDTIGPLFRDLAGDRLAIDPSYFSRKSTHTRAYIYRKFYRSTKYTQGIQTPIHLSTHQSPYAHSTVITRTIQTTIQTTIQRTIQPTKDRPIHDRPTRHSSKGSHVASKVITTQGTLMLQTHNEYRPTLSKTNHPRYHSNTHRVGIHRTSQIVTQKASLYPYTTQRSLDPKTASMSPQDMHSRKRLSNGCIRVWGMGSSPDLKGSAAIARRAAHKKFSYFFRAPGFYHARMAVHPRPGSATRAPIPRSIRRGYVPRAIPWNVA